jgi:hypothetical protein
MSGSFFTVRKDGVFAAGSNVFSTKISATPTAYGLTAGQASNYASLNGTFQTAYQAVLDPATKTKATVSTKNTAREPLRQSASSLAKIINGTPTVTDSQKIDLGLAVGAQPSPRPAPGTPFKFNVQLQSDGSLLLGWKCNNPKGASGTMYQVFRRTGSSGDFTYLGGAGTRSFLDDSIPAGTSLVTYRIQAVRSTSVGDWAEYNVNFGTGGSAPVVEEVMHLKKAA